MYKLKRYTVHSVDVLVIIVIFVVIVLSIGKSDVFAAETLDNQTFTVDNIEYKIVSTDKVEIINYNREKKGEINFGAYVTYDGHTYTIVHIKNCLLEGCREITSVNLPDTIEYIGEGAFRNCTNLSALRLPNNKNLIVEYEAFSGCIDLLEITLPEQLKNVQHHAFQNCTSLTTVRLNTINCEAITERRGSDETIFKGCMKLEKVYIGEKVTVVPTGIFSGCTGLKKIVYEGDNVRKIGGAAFAGCKSLETLELPDSLTEINPKAFMFCTSLKEVTIPENIKKLGYGVFGSCNNIETINFNAINCTSMGESGWAGYLYTFGGVSGISENMSGVKKLIIGEKVQRIPQYAFGGCPNLESINIPASVSSIQANAFENLPKLLSIVVSGNNSIYTDHDGILYTKDNKMIIRCPEGKELLTAGCFIGVTQIGNVGFSNCTRLKQINLPDTIEYIGEGAFRNCTNLSALRLPNNKNLIVEYEAFSGCIALPEITLPEQLKNVQHHAFQNCTSLTTVRLNTINCEAITERRGSDETIFKGCMKLEKVYIGEKVTVVPTGIFSGCTGLKKIIYEGDNVRKIGGAAFAGCKSLETLELPDSLTEINPKAFMFCTSLKEVTIPENIKKLGYGIFGSCNNIETINFNAINCTSMGESGWAGYLYTFGGVSGISENMSGVKKLIIGEKVQRIPQYAFGGCPNLESIKIYNKACDIYSGENGGRTFEEDAIIYGYLDSTAEEYAAKYGRTFRIIGSDYSYDHSTELEEWLLNQGSLNSIMYLTKDENFMCSRAVAESDSSFADHFVQTITNMLYCGLDGWKDIFSLATTKEQAREVLIALLDTYGSEVEELADAETAYKYANLYVKTLQESDWAYAIDFGLKDNEIDQLKEVCTEDVLAQFFIDGKYETISAYLQIKGGYSADSKAVKCIEQFTKSKKLTNELSDSIGLLGDGLQILSMTNGTINRLYEVERLATADEMFSEMLIYLNKNCIFIPVREAADELYTVIHGSYSDQLKYATTSLKDAAEVKSVDLILEAAAEKLPYGKIIKKNYEFAVGISNTVFGIADMQKQKDNMRCVAYIGNCLSSWLLDSRQQWEAETGTRKAWYAKKTVYAYKMLLKSRIQGERSLQKMMEVSKTTWKKAYNYSLEVSSTLKSMQDFFNIMSTSVIACPVDVQIYDASGRLVCTVHDGSSSEGYLDDIYYAVLYNPLENDFVKIIRTPIDKNYSLRCLANDLGQVDYSISTISEQGINIRKEAQGIPIKQGDEISISDLSGDNPTCKLLEGNQVIREYPAELKDKYIPVESMQIDKKTLELEPGKRVKLNAIFLPSNASNQEVIWISSNQEVATVNQDGVVKGISKGTAEIVVESLEGNFKNVCQVTVVDNRPVNKNSQVIYASSVTKTYGNKPFNLNAKTSGGGKLTYNSSNTNVATINNTGKITLKGPGKASITINAAATDNYNAATKQINITVKPKKAVLKKAKSTKKRTLKVGWVRDKKVTGYQVVIAQNRKFHKGKKSALITKNKTTSKTFKKLRRDKTYYYKVRAYKQVGKTKIYGAYSKTKRIKVK
ncbi:leucine-rich repeat protein [Ihubacter massiliensis]|uniref:Leucine-rich repeat protein n=1 Tax=Hominibacterium faecale TaxID=2839743 RepID=A0A9J6QW34_9FIRM|nr:MULTISPECIES: leucine-rich repeat protein [Eubacteriales Family XIII. Incertae Sedis]MCO7121697.1 leucine-rich repeat protein [Ihubacter massiliensis]MCU7378678.1 leucine-rich repeat protein [Hominibacterium faecale]